MFRGFMINSSFSLSYLVILVFNLIYLILLTVIILSWIPIFDIRKEPLASMHRFYNLIMAPFKAIIPPIGMIDISPIFAFLLLQFIQNAILKILAQLGL